MERGLLCNDVQIQHLSSDLLGLVLVKTLLLNTSADERNHVYSIYVTLTSVSRAWRQTITGQPWFHATPTQHVLSTFSDGKSHVF